MLSLLVFFFISSSLLESNITQLCITCVLLLLVFHCPLIYNWLLEYIILSVEEATIFYLPKKNHTMKRKNYSTQNIFFLRNKVKEEGMDLFSVLLLLFSLFCKLSNNFSEDFTFNMLLSCVFQNSFIPRSCFRLVLYTL